MSNSYQEKFNELESGSAAIKKKLEGGIKFKIKSDFQPSGDQPEAIKKIIKNLKEKSKNKFYWELLAQAKLSQWLK